MIHPQGFEAKDNKLSKYSRALGHPARVLIMRTISEAATCICGDIVEQLPLAQSTVSQHLKELRRAGLIKAEVNGPKTCYSLNQENLKDYFKRLDNFKNSLSTNSILNIL